MYGHRQPIPKAGRLWNRKGDRVMFNGAVYISTEDNNVWSPDTYGWEIE